MTDPAAIERFYRERDADLTTQADALEKRRRTVEILRLIAFAAGAGMLVWILARGDEDARALWTATAILAAGFISLVIVHSRLASREVRMRDRALLARMGVHRIRRDWNALPDGEWRPPSD